MYVCRHLWRTRPHGQCWRYVKLVCNAVMAMMQLSLICGGMHSCLQSPFVARLVISRARDNPEGGLVVISQLQVADDVCNCCRYCECFASGRYCDGCNCVNCCNNRENESVRQSAVEAILERNPNAFRPKIQVSSFCSGHCITLSL